MGTINRPRGVLVQAQCAVLSSTRAPPSFLSRVKPAYNHELCRYTDDVTPPSFLSRVKPAYNHELCRYTDDVTPPSFLSRVKTELITKEWCQQQRRVDNERVVPAATYKLSASAHDFCMKLMLPRLQSAPMCTLRLGARS
jgi:hypothetical protein